MTAKNNSVVDCHGHIIEPFDLWTTYIDPKYRDRAVRFDRSPEGVDYMVVDNKPAPYTYGATPFMVGYGIPYERLRQPGLVHFEDGPEGAFNAGKRLEFLDAEGIDLSLIYPSCGLLWGPDLKDVVLNDAYTRAYNNWAIDFCRTTHNRLFPVALLPVLDIDVAINEVRRTAATGGFKAYLMFATPLTSFGFWSKQYDPLWAEIEATGLPVVFHPSLNDRFFGRQWATEEIEGILDDRYLLYIEICAAVTDMQGALAQLFQGGTFDRFPHLNIVMLEVGAGWIQPFLERSDIKCRRLGTASPLKKLPSEYFARQIWVGIDQQETVIPAMVARYGAERFVWGTDLPHWDNFPGTLGDIRRIVEPLDAAEQAKILGVNARQLFCLN